MARQPDGMAARQVQLDRRWSAAPLVALTAVFTIACAAWPALWLLTGHPVLQP